MDPPPPLPTDEIELNNLDQSSRKLVQEAYTRCLALEHHATVANGHDGGTPSLLLSARFLGRMILEAPSPTGLVTFSREVNSCMNDEGLCVLARYYIDHFINCFRSYTGPTPQPSLHPSRPSFDNIQDLLKFLLEEAPSGDTTAKEKHEFAGTAWAVLEHFGNINHVVDEISRHGLNNIMTLDCDLHANFDQLWLWLEATDVPHRYKINSLYSGIIAQLPDYVQFSTLDPINLPLPNPCFVRLHAACARVAYLSGAAEYIEKVLRDMEMTRVLRLVALESVSVKVQPWYFVDNSNALQPLLLRYSGQGPLHNPRTEPSLPITDLKSKAAKAKDAGVSKLSTTRDHLKSVPSAKTGFDPNSRQLPPPPPPLRAYPSQRSAGSRSAPLPPPPVRRTTSSSTGPPPVLQGARPVSVTPSPPLPPAPPALPRRNTSAFSSRSSVANKDGGEVVIDRIDWANLSPADKQVFFSWLDEFFARYLDQSIHPRSTQSEVKGNVESHSSVGAFGRRMPPPPSRSPAPSLSSHGPPKPNLSTKPSCPIPEDPHLHLEMSYPPPTTHGSSALDLAYYFHPSTSWPDPWYSSPTPLPPSLQNRTDIRYASSTLTTSTRTTLSTSVLFPDLSISWYTVIYPLSPHTSTPPTITRTHKFLPRPHPLPGATLETASALYGEPIARFAESFLDTQRFCARGECWDLAHEALQHTA
ncbi:hypothetical protein EW146_g3321, partial [Bondarzewia mesenterica]